MPILTESQDTNTRFFALRLLERVIKTSWKDLNEQKQSIMSTVVGINNISFSSSHWGYFDVRRDGKEPNSQ
jgi:hypothetical protein